MEILTVMHVNKKALKYYTAASIAFSEVLSETDINNKYYIGVRTDTGYYVDVDIMRMHSDRKEIQDLTTWEELENTLTQEMVYGYQVTIPWSPYVIEKNGNKSAYKKYSNPKNIVHPNIYTIENDNRFEIGYVSINDPTKRNISVLKTFLKDIVITPNEDILEHITLENCIVSINGVVHRTLVYENELYILDGTKNFHGTPGSNSPNITLIDMSPVGSLEQIKFMNTTSYYSYEDDKMLGTIKIKLPDETDMTNKSLMLVLAGKLYFCDEVDALSKDTILIDPSKYDIDRHMLEKQLFRGERLVQTNHILASMTKEEYYDSIFNEEVSDAFIILVNNSNLKVVRQTSFHVDAEDKRVFFSSDVSRCFVIDKYSKALVGVCLNNFSDGSAFDMNPRIDKYQIDGIIGDKSFMTLANLGAADLLELNSQSVFEAVLLTA